MLIILIVLVLLSTGITLLVTKNRIEDYETRRFVDEFGFLLTAIGTIVGFFAAIFLITNILSYEVEYQNTLHKKEMLEYRIELIEENITGNEMIYNDIVEFNNSLRSLKKWANNPFTNWFCNRDIASIDYIELKIKITEDDYEQI